MAGCVEGIRRALVLGLGPPSRSIIRSPRHQVCFPTVQEHLSLQRIITVTGNSDIEPVH